MAKTYTSVKLVNGSDYPSVSIWKYTKEKPANLFANSMEFELNTADLLPGKYRFNIWLNKNKSSDKSPDANIVLERITDDEAPAQSEGPAGSTPAPIDFSF